MKAKLLFTLLSISILFVPVLYAQTPPTGSTAVIYGCMNPTAKNFNPLATKDNGNCDFDSVNHPPVMPPMAVMYGCTNPNAKNYNRYAKIDNHSCVFDSTYVYGCMNPKAKNYNPLAQRENGSCIFGDSTSLSTVIYGCKDSTARNFNPYATINNHNCIYKTILPGCRNPLAKNFDPKANVNNNDTCKFDFVIWGCTDSTALNYNPKANHNSGYCIYTKPIRGCTDNTAINYNPLANRDNRTCIFLSNDSIKGCTDPYALNYNKFAKKDNGNCKYELVSDSIRGCKDTLALNFNPLATISGKCVYPKDSTTVAGCKSPKALNFNPKASHEDGSCVFARPVNIILPVVNKNLTAITDTLGLVLKTACNFDYTIPVDTVYIVKANRINNRDVEIDWAIEQGSVITNVKTVFSIEKQGIALLYLSLICNQGIAASGSPTTGNLNKVSSIGTDLVKGVTLSALYSNKIISGIVNSMSNENGVAIYPNPVNDQLNVSYVASGNDDLELNVYSIDGRRLISTKVSSTSGANQFEINTTSLKSGLHFITINKNGVALKTLKFAKF
jgi:NAD-dependent dihydropyrimidine dehydrogenase PreA subunit